jgi:hypothetical protein
MFEHVRSLPGALEWFASSCVGHDRWLGGCFVRDSLQSSVLETSIRTDLFEAHRTARQSLASGGNWWSARSRRALAITAIRAMWANDPLPPWASDDAIAEFVGLESLGDTPIAAHRAAARMARHAATLDRAWYEQIADQIGALAYVELVGIVCVAAATSSLRHSLGFDPFNLPPANDDAASRAEAPALAEARLNWVPVAAPADASAAVVQALSAVPAAHSDLWRLADAQYIPDLEMVDPLWTRGTLTRVEMELVATEVSWARECHY